MKWNWIVTIGSALLLAPGEAPALCGAGQSTGATDSTATEASSVETAPAQTFDAPQGPGDLAYQTVVRRLRAGQNVRITTSSVRFKLRWAGASLDGISGALSDNASGAPQAAVSSDSASVQWSEIQRIDVRGRATNTGWPIGLVVGALGGIAAGVALSQVSIGFGNELSAERVEGVAIYFGVVGALGGAVAGAIIGTAFPKWHAIYKQK